MRKALSKRQLGFTIVELLVVIVVIGILAAIALVSYTGISQKAVVASMQTDLSSSASKLKMYYTDNGKYPASLIGNCPADASNNIDSRYCLKPSSGNTFSYSSTSPYSTFSLTVTHSTTSYVVTESSAPTVAGAPQPIFASGGVINPTTGTRKHTFGTSCTSASPCVITAAASGTITVAIDGGGGGGGGLYSGINGANGGNSSFRIGVGSPCTANGGTGGLSTYNVSDGAPGITTTGCGVGLVSGNAGNGGGAGCDGGCTPSDDSAGAGGPGGRITGSISIATGNQVTIIVGSGGSGGTGDESYGDSGSDGVVTISYPY